MTPSQAPIIDLIHEQPPKATQFYVDFIPYRQNQFFWKIHIFKFHSFMNKMLKIMFNLVEILLCHRFNNIVVDLKN